MCRRLLNNNLTFNSAQLESSFLAPRGEYLVDVANISVVLVRFMRVNVSTVPSSSENGGQVIFKPWSSASTRPLRPVVFGGFQVGAGCCLM